MTFENFPGMMGSVRPDRKFWPNRIRTILAGTGPQPDYKPELIVFIKLWDSMIIFLPWLDYQLNLIYNF